MYALSSILVSRIVPWPCLFDRSARLAILLRSPSTGTLIRFPIYSSLMQKLLSANARPATLSLSQLKHVIVAPLSGSSVFSLVDRVISYV